ncbi:hypothetical protein Dxin01_03943 [Deinococcus xinjiangensis]|uniref:Lipoprotein n=1 Tax=Deinococcus xinjiangensis TaxID=457454 RepID=A0ABP9VG31_9DEIO
MKNTRILPALLLPVLLAACTDPGQSVPDPLTQPFTGTGSLVNYTPNQTYTLSVPVTSGTANVGQIGTDKAVSITVTPDVAQQRARTLTDFVNSVKAAGCDVTGISLQDTTYRSFSQFDFTTSTGKAATVEARSEATNADGTVNVTRKSFWFASTAGRMTGQYVCDGTATTFDIALKPGWNIVDQTSVRNPSTATSTNVRYANAVSSNTYAGSWYAYTKN